MSTTMPARSKRELQWSCCRVRPRLTMSMKAISAQMVSLANIPLHGRLGSHCTAIVACDNSGAALLQKHSMPSNAHVQARFWHRPEVAAFAQGGICLQMALLCQH